MSDTVRVKGLSDLNRFFDALPEKYARNVARGGVRAGANVIATEARANIRSQSGRLAADVKVGTRARGMTVKGYVRNKLFYASFVEFGTAPHKIRPKNRQALSIGGFFAKSVEHPGAKPHPYMRPALDRQAGAAVVAFAEYSKARLRDKHGLDTSSVLIEGDEA